MEIQAATRKNIYPDLLLQFFIILNKNINFILVK